MESTRSRYGHFRCCYEASFSGTVLYDTLTEHGVDCAIIAPGLIPKCSGDRIKIDQRDARNLSKYFGSGLLTECFVQLRAVRGLLSSREAQIKSLHQSKIRGIHFLHAHGHCYTTGRIWTKKFGSTTICMELINFGFTKIIFHA